MLEASVLAERRGWIGKFKGYQELDILDGDPNLVRPEE
jgi:hypothetical protein